ncbi:MAG: hypothetical protein HY898_07755 [Deltaproteobacteria bacterium]|nr:hypothetical protein [Deltaproteobacteria bacterium]
MPHFRSLTILAALALAACSRSGSARNDRPDASPEVSDRVQEIKRDLPAQRVTRAASEMWVAPDGTAYLRRRRPDEDALERVTAKGESSVLATCSTHLVADLGEGGARWVCWDKGKVEAHLESRSGHGQALRGPAGTTPEAAHSSLCGDTLYTLGDNGLAAIPLDGSASKVLNENLRPTECPALFCRYHPVRRVGEDLFVVQAESIVRLPAIGGPAVPIAKLAPPGRALEPQLYGLLVSQNELYFGVLDTPGAGRAGHDVMVATERGSRHAQVLSRIMGGFAVDDRFVYWSDCFDLGKCGVYRKVKTAPVRQVERLAVVNEVAGQVFVAGNAVLYTAQGALWRVQLSP